MMQPRFTVRVDHEHVKRVLDARRRRCIGESYRIVRPLTGEAPAIKGEVW